MMERMATKILRMNVTFVGAQKVFFVGAREQLCLLQFWWHRHFWWHRPKDLLAISEFPFQLDLLGSSRFGNLGDGRGRPTVLWRRYETGARSPKPPAVHKGWRSRLSSSTKISSLSQVDGRSSAACIDGRTLRSRAEDRSEAVKTKWIWGVEAWSDVISFSEGLGSTSTMVLLTHRIVRFDPFLSHTAPCGTTSDTDGREGNWFTLNLKTVILRLQMH